MGGRTKGRLMWQVLPPPYLIKIHKNCRNGKKIFRSKEQRN